MASVESLAKPELLRWARESRGLDIDEAAAKAQVSSERLAGWETGAGGPTVSQLRLLASAYKRSIAVFYLPSIPKSAPRPRDFRRLPGEVAGEESATLRLETRKAVLRRRAALDLFELDELKPPRPALTLVRTDPEISGGLIREFLGVSLVEQYGWETPYEALNSWRNAFERAGVMTTQMKGVDPGEASGFSMAEDPLPIVVLNSSDFPRRRIFTLFHELAHIGLDESGLCDLDDFSKRGRHELAVERFCNAVAGTALLPRDALLEEGVIRRHPKGNPEWSTDDLDTLSARYGVSAEAVLRRLVDVDLTSWDFYQSKTRELRARIAGFLERRAAPKGPPSPPVIAVANSGQLLSRLTMASLARGLITGAEASEYLDVQVKHFPKIQERIAGS